MPENALPASTHALTHSLAHAHTHARTQTHSAFVFLFDPEKKEARRALSYLQQHVNGRLRLLNYSLGEEEGKNGRKEERREGGKGRKEEGEERESGGRGGKLVASQDERRRRVVDRQTHRQRDR